MRRTCLVMRTFVQNKNELYDLQRHFYLHRVKTWFVKACKAYWVKMN